MQAIWTEKSPAAGTSPEITGEWAANGTIARLNNITNHLEAKWTSGKPRNFINVCGGAARNMSPNRYDINVQPISVDSTQKAGRIDFQG